MHCFIARRLMPLTVPQFLHGIPARRGESAMVTLSDADLPRKQESHAMNYYIKNDVRLWRSSNTSQVKAVTREIRPRLSFLLLMPKTCEVCRIAGRCMLRKSSRLITSCVCSRSSWRLRTGSCTARRARPSFIRGASRRSVVLSGLDRGSDAAWVAARSALGLLWFRIALRTVPCWRCGKRKLQGTGSTSRSESKRCFEKLPKKFFL
mmetsp:Transcript_53318/g.117067  ORF Transcript_53318/g.117067 Transcript_53318/m.117067 type:complete len:207 (-) Transcript_53318:84-704(-)